MLALIALPHVGQDTIQEEDGRFRAFLEGEGWDTGKMGMGGGGMGSKGVGGDGKRGKEENEGVRSEI